MGENGKDPLGEDLTGLQYKCLASVCQVKTETTKKETNKSLDITSKKFKAPFNGTDPLLVLTTACLLCLEREVQDSGSLKR